MLKLRIEGKESEISRFIENIHCNESVEVNSISDLYPNRKSIYSRCYLEIELFDDERSGDDDD
ncbi:MAG: hypothetical protein IJI66_09000 [Erysipelotrichaceae bacterium]|nr:hypothetical protein [Erysipelotrichaceae bacterium]